MLQTQLQTRGGQCCFLVATALRSFALLACSIFSRSFDIRTVFSHRRLMRAICNQDNRWMGTTDRQRLLSVTNSRRLVVNGQKVCAQGGFPQKRDQKETKRRPFRSRNCCIQFALYGPTGEPKTEVINTTGLVVIAVTSSHVPDWSTSSEQVHRY